MTTGTATMDGSDDTEVIQIEHVMQQCKGRLVQGFEERLWKIWHQIWRVWKLTGWKLEYELNMIELGELGELVSVPRCHWMNQKRDCLQGTNGWDTSPGVHGPITRMCWIRINLALSGNCEPYFSWYFLVQEYYEHKFGHLVKQEAGKLVSPKTRNCCQTAPDGLLSCLNIVLFVQTVF